MTQIARAECPTCHVALEGPQPASITCGCGTTLSIHGGSASVPTGPLETRDREEARRARVTSAAAELASAPLGRLGGGSTYA